MEYMYLLLIFHGYILEHNSKARLSTLQTKHASYFFFSDTGDKACTGVEAGLRSVWGVKTYKVYHLYALCPVQSTPDAISTLKRKIDAIKVEVADTCGCLKLKCITKKK